MAEISVTGGGGAGITSLALTDTHIYVGDATNTAQDVALTLSATGGTFALANTGVLTMPNADASTRGLVTAANFSKFSLFEVQLSCSDLVNAITTGTTKAYFRSPTAFTLTQVRASLLTAQTSGNIFTVDINKSGTSILSTKLTIDNNETTSVTAATPAVISDSAITDDVLITIDVDQIGNGTAIGLIVTLIGTL
jgi:hypothetical protein